MSARLAQGFKAALRLVLPVVFLLATGAICAVYTDTPAPGLGTLAGHPLSLGAAALLPSTFLVIHLANRRYGAACAFGQVLLAWLIAIAALPWLLPYATSLPDVRVAAAFGGALFLAQAMAVILFDRLRGPTWWKAPFFSSAIAGLLFCLLAFPAAFAGTAFNWSNEMLGFMALCAAASLVLLVPYGLLRGLLPPRSGLGGY